jgi:hypothetical protein
LREQHDRDDRRRRAQKPIVTESTNVQHLRSVCGRGVPWRSHACYRSGVGDQRLMAHPRPASSPCSVDWRCP